MRQAFVGLLVMAAGCAGVAVAEVPPARWDAAIVRVIDGDSLVARVTLWPGVEQVGEIRLVGVDTPEVHGKCDAERSLAVRARDFVAQTLPVGLAVQLTHVRADKYGGRWLATVALPNGQTVQDLLLQNQYAVPYRGTGPRKDWCADTEAREGGSRSASGYGVEDTARGQSPTRRDPFEAWSAARWGVR